MRLRVGEQRAPEAAVDEPDPSDPHATALYIGKMAGELRSLAANANLPFLAYLLAMVEEEAQKQPQPSR